MLADNQSFGNELLRVTRNHLQLTNSYVATTLIINNTDVIHIVSPQIPPNCVITYIGQPLKVYIFLYNLLGFIAHIRTCTIEHYSCMCK